MYNDDWTRPIVISNEKRPTQADYDALFKRFTEDTSMMSFTQVNHLCFRILRDADVDVVVPMLLKSLKETQGKSYSPDFDPWAACLLLHHHTSVLPYREEDRGRLNPIRNAWVKWGEENGYTV